VVVSAAGEQRSVIGDIRTHTSEVGEKESIRLINDDLKQPYWLTPRY
jgi:hypothetical protein